MWVSNLMFKCTTKSRVLISPSMWQRSSSVSRCAFSSAPVKEGLLSPQRTSLQTLVLCSSLKRNFHFSKCCQTEVIPNLAKDVILFKFDNERLFKIITLFGCVNFAMFMTISLNIYTILSKQASGEDEASGGTSEFDGDTSESSAVAADSAQAAKHGLRPGFAKLFSLDKSDTEGGKGAISPSHILTGLCGVTFALGYLVLAGTWIYCTNQVRYLVLRKGGQKVTVITHGLFGNNRYRTWNLNKACLQHGGIQDMEMKVNVRGNRSISSAVLLNAKGKFFSYILDKRGTYTNPRLFDTTVGVPRSLK